MFFLPSNLTICSLLFFSNLLVQHAFIYVHIYKTSSETTLPITLITTIFSIIAVVVCVRIYIHVYTSLLFVEKNLIWFVIKSFQTCTNENTSSREHAVLSVKTFLEIFWKKITQNIIKWLISFGILSISSC